jgi:isocitrate/isopropylmalate dehydrogenase
MTSRFTVSVLPGDGIGPETVSEVLPVVEQLDLGVTFRLGEIGWECWRREGEPVPEATWRLIAETDTCLLGAITSKPAREAEAELPEHLRGQGRRYVSPVIQLRQRLGLYANVRPIVDMIDGRFDVTIIRENTEGMYAGIDLYPTPEAAWELVKEHPNAAASGPHGTSMTVRLQTDVGVRQLLRFGFECARRRGVRLTVADKPNVLRQSSTLLRHQLETLSEEYPDVPTEILNVDAVGLWLVRRPERFGVIVAENMFGDILSDVGAAVMGGLGLAPSANIGRSGSYFEPVHGSAPSLAGRGLVNPMATFLAVALMLDHLGLSVPALQVRDAVRHVRRRAQHVTYDLGGTASTRESAAAVGAELAVTPDRPPGDSRGAAASGDVLAPAGSSIAGDLVRGDL